MQTDIIGIFSITITLTWICAALIILSAGIKPGHVNHIAQQQCLHEEWKK